MKNNTILFVEDEATIREELSQFLERYTDRGLYIGENGEEGLALYEKYHPDIVISDPEFKSKVQFLKDNLKKEFLRVVSFGFEEVRC